MNLFGNPSLPPTRRRIIKRAKPVTSTVNTGSLEGKVVFYDTANKPVPVQLDIVNPKPVAPPKPATSKKLPKRYELLFEEILAWKKRVNSRLNKLSQEQTVKDVLREMVLPVLREMRTNPSAAPQIAPSTSASTSGASSTLEVQVNFKSKVYSVPDKMGKLMCYVDGGTKLRLYEPWTENESGVWMRTHEGGWFQLWDRTTNVYHCT